MVERLMVLAIGGFDPSGGAGVVRDFLTARTLGAAVRLIPTAWTQQSPGGVRRVEPRAPAALRAAVREELVLAQEQVARASGGKASIAVKIGMLPNDGAAAAVGEALEGFAGPVVLDPVLGASSGGALFSGELAALFELGRRVTVLTPNAWEAEALSGRTVRTEADAEAAGALLRSRGVASVLIKGGHLDGADEAVDVLISAAGVTRFRAPRGDHPPVRGTGCALATALAVGLAGGRPLPAAVAEAKEWLRAALGHAVAVGGEWHLS